MQLLQDEVLPIEFFLLGKRRFGGEIKKTDYDGLTKDFLANYSGYSVDYISQLNMRFTVGRDNSVILHLQKRFVPHKGTNRFLLPRLGHDSLLR